MFKYQISNFTKIFPGTAEFCADGPTDVTKLIAAFRSSVRTDRQT